MGALGFHGRVQTARVVTHALWLSCTKASEEIPERSDTVVAAVGAKSRSVEVKVKVKAMLFFFDKRS